MPARPPPWFDDDYGFDSLRDLFRSVEYTEKGIVESLGSGAPSRNQTVQLHRTAGGSPRETLIRLLLMGAPVEQDALVRAIQPMSLQAWVGAGLIETQGTEARALVYLAPHRSLWIAADRPTRSAGSIEVETDYVMGVARSSTMLDSYTVRRPSRATLDVGTGCGYQALRAAEHSNQVLATDANPRALAFTRFNARLNSVAGLETAAGDLFEPAGTRQFDLIVTNPPFVVSPRASFTYRDSGLEGDQIIEKIVRAAPTFLQDGGFCQMLCNWAHHKGKDWKSRLAAWFEGSGCDAWLLRSETTDAATYASFWISHTVGPAADRPGGLFDDWTAYYDRLGIEAVSAGLIVMRKRSSASNWLRIDDEPPAFQGDCGEHILRGFAAWDYLAGAGTASEMLAGRFRLAPDCRASIELEPGDSDWSPLGARLRHATGMGYEGGTDLQTLNLMARCDGRRTLRELTDELAAAIGRDPDAVASATIPVINLMLQRGFLLPPAKP